MKNQSVLVKTRRLSQITLAVSSVLAFAGCASSSSQTSSNANTNSGAKMVQISAHEFEKQKKQLLKTMQQLKPRDGFVGQPGQPVTEISVTDCTWFGGTVVAHAGCTFTGMKCVGANGKEACITEVK